MQDKPLEKKSQSPLYQQLMARLKNDILAGVYPSGARIPSEQLLCETYGVSRVTVRKAMLDLVQEGLLVRRQGKGTFVADERIQRDLLQITSFSAACRQNGHCAGTKVIDRTSICGRPFQEGSAGSSLASCLFTPLACVQPPVASRIISCSFMVSPLTSAWISPWYSTSARSHTRMISCASLESTTTATPRSARRRMMS